MNGRMIATGKAIGQEARALEIREPTFHPGGAEYSEMPAEERVLSPSGGRRLKKLEIENMRLKKLLAEAQLVTEI